MSRFPILGILSVGSLFAQTPIVAGDGGAVHLYPADAVALELAEPQTALPCVLRPAQPELGFDLAFLVRFTADVKVREIAGDGNLLTSIFRVVPDGAPDEAIYFQQKWSVPQLPEKAFGETSLDGAFRVGEGDYQVDWMMRDRQERICSSHWRISARMPAKERPIASGIPPGAIAPVSPGPWEGRGPLESSGRKIDLTILLNLTPFQSTGVATSGGKTEVLLAMLRAIVRDRRIGSVTLQAFHLDTRQVIFDREEFEPSQFAVLEQAIEAHSTGTVSVAQLVEKGVEARFLVRLATEQAQRRPSNALLFVGSQMVDDTVLTRDLLKELGEPRSPVFYLMYAPTRDWSPWRDLVGVVVRQWRGREYSVAEPLDLIVAWSKIMSQLAGPSAISRLAR